MAGKKPRPKRPGKSGNRTQSEPGSFTTPLDQIQEMAYRIWLNRNGVTDADSPQSGYDYRGAFKEGLRRALNGHWPDTFKQPWHPTFSDESKYASLRPEQAGHWTQDARGNWVFVPPEKR